MKKFDVEITETLQRTVSVEAASQEEAERMVTEAFTIRHTSICTRTRVHALHHTGALPV